MINRLNSTDSDFNKHIEKLLGSTHLDSLDVEGIVKGIISEVRLKGDESLVAYTNKFDNVAYQNFSELKVSRAEMQHAADALDPLVKNALQTSIDRVKTYHLKQKEMSTPDQSWSFKDGQGNEFGQILRSMGCVGVYVPGGKAAYPSSIIMTVIPAVVAGVGKVVLTVPAPGGELSPVILAAAHLCGVDEMYKLGGAQAIAALAYGTETVPRVDKIVGPGNIYVATAKKLVFGDVGIDMIAGPSEVVIVADATTDPDWLAMDMFAQAEHDELAQSILISTDAALLDAVEESISKQLKEMKRRDIITTSIFNRGALIHVPTLAAAFDIVNQIAPEHLELAVDNAEDCLSLIKHAGAIFVGRFSAEAVGDYTAGPSHVLPTSGTARFASPLGVNDFQVRSSMIHCSPRGAIELSRAAAIIATEEGLEAHAKSAEFRFRG
jgi:histidinol dehydrogenase